MKVKELVAKLLVCDQEAEVEHADGSGVTQVVRHSGMRRVSLSVEDNESTEETLASGWGIVS